jgi:organic radical activating enzyme
MFALQLKQLQWRYGHVRRRYFRRTPAAIQVELTTRCNLEPRVCPTHCSGSATPPTERDGCDMAESVFVRLLQQIKRVRPDCRLILAGCGEPTTHPEFAPWLHRMKTVSGLRVELVTNGMTLAPPLREFLIQEGLDRIEVNLHANPAALDGEEGIVRRLEQAAAQVGQLIAERNRRGFPLPWIAVQLTDTPAVHDVIEDVVEHWLRLADEVIVQRARAPGGRRPATETPTHRRRPCHLVYSPATFLCDGALALCSADWHGEHTGGNIMTTDLEFLVRFLNSPQILHRRGHAAEIPLCAECSLWMDQLGRFRREGSRIVWESPLRRRIWQESRFWRWRSP